MSSLIRFFLIFSLILLASCASPESKNPKYEKINSRSVIKKRVYVPSDIRQVKDIPQFEESNDLIAPGFLFSINHPSDEKLRGQFRVNFDGMLRLPYRIHIQTDGMDFATLKKRVKDECNKFFQRGADDVSFQLLQKQYWVEVRGFVKRSGYYLVKRKEQIDRVIAMAGGLSGSLKTDFFIVSVKQKDISYSVSLNQYYEENVLGKSFTWTGGDTVFINLLNQDTHSQAVPMVSIIGGVLAPGKVLYRENATLYYYLGKTGGVIPNLGYEEAWVFRKEGEKIERIKFNITEMDSIPDIRAGDTIMLNGEKKTLADKIWERTIQVGSIITSIAILIIAL